MLYPKTIQITKSFTFSQWDEINTLVWDMANQLTDMQIPAKIVATSAMDEPGRQCREGVTIHRFNYFYPNWPLSRNSYLKLDHLGADPFSPQLMSYLNSSYDTDLFHCHCMGRLGHATRKAAKLLHIPWILTMPDLMYHSTLEDQQDPPEIDLKFTIPYGKLLDLFHGHGPLASYADGLVATNYDNYLKLLKAFPNTPAFYLPPSIETGGYKQKAYQFRLAQKITAERELILNVSPIDPAYNQLLLLELVQLLVKEERHPMLVMIGSITNAAYHQSLLHFINENQLQKYVDFIPALPPDSEELKAAFLEADLYIHPAYHDPFGRSLLHAWAAGCPVLSSNQSTPGQLITSNRTGLTFSPDQVVECLQVYHKLHTSPTLIDQLVSKGKELVCSKHDWLINRNKLLDFYKAVIQRFRDKQRTSSQLSSS